MISGGERSAADEKGSADPRGDAATRRDGFSLRRQPIQKPEQNQPDHRRHRPRTSEQFQDHIDDDENEHDVESVACRVDRRDVVGKLHNLTGHLQIGRHV